MKIEGGGRPTGGFNMSKDARAAAATILLNDQRFHQRVRGVIDVLREQLEIGEANVEIGLEITGMVLTVKAAQPVAPQPADPA